MSDTPFADGAAPLAEQGIRVFRIRPRAKAGGARWVHGPPSEVATADVAEITRRARRYPDSNVGIATGDRLVVLDIDTHHGGRRPEWAILTREASTPNGGLHLYYRTDGYVKNSAGRVAVGVDVRGDGGMVVAPPSRTDVGRYEWVTALDAPMAFVPAARFHEYDSSDAAGTPLGASRRKRPEDVRAGERHDQAVLWASWFHLNYDPDDAADLTWQLVARFADPVPPGDPGIEAVINWINKREAAAA